MNTVWVPSCSVILSSPRQNQELLYTKPHFPQPYSLSVAPLPTTTVLAASNFYWLVWNKNGCMSLFPLTFYRIYRILHCLDPLSIQALVWHARVSIDSYSGHVLKSFWLSYALCWTEIDLSTGLSAFLSLGTWMPRAGLIYLEVSLTNTSKSWKVLFK